VSWDTVSPGYRPLSWGYPGILRMPPVSHDANLRFQTVPTRQTRASGVYAMLTLRKAVTRCDQRHQHEITACYKSQNKN